ncbi:MAG: Rho GTPase activation protein [Benjaminiella poitrasii]|nr:MAG: Rho GTPase activation protein [Benjaminiella poitrasii]
MSTTTVDLSNDVTSQKEGTKTWWKKAGFNNSNALQIPKVIANSKRKVFGVPLLDSLYYAHSRISYFDERTGKVCNGFIPTVIAKCGVYLKEEGLYTEGIFRLSGNAKRISLLQTMFDTPEDYGLYINWSGYTVHDASNLMRRFLNHLPEPVIITKYQPLFKNTMAAPFPSLEAKIEAFQNLIEKLPILHQYLLFYLLDILSVFSLYVDTTRMDISSLATAFTPGILLDPNDTMNPSGYKESKRVLEFLIEYQDKFYLPPTFIDFAPGFFHHDNNTEQDHDHKAQHGCSNTSISKLKDTTEDQRIPYSNDRGLYSETNLSTFKRRASINNNEQYAQLTMPTRTMLKRSKTAPSKSFRGSTKHEETAIAPTEDNNEKNTTLFNQTSRATIGRWKSIKRIIREEEQKKKKKA